ncbi:uncharacterized protein BT62DRAFT_931021 [Guyanagaster necrorhizus]|uniref:Uncharacterized protein n=1 Tax=Guyanagaster necrorhizus TaxID=856835 RepID=A0A9P7VV58_9AGAR|nr:uncharacterized protein BT62DRAFT_931021 [Guyanagaster necrorhizus MCA 3950]KAG7447188.1 hypothetical protein BT62DRAFT_931021 [Guyanagaster necrorhizus MCA 3950]
MTEPHTPLRLARSISQIRITQVGAGSVKLDNLRPIVANSDGVCEFLFLALTNVTESERRRFPTLLTGKI